MIKAGSIEFICKDLPLLNNYELYIKNEKNELILYIYNTQVS